MIRGSDLSRKIKFCVLERRADYSPRCYILRCVLDRLEESADVLRRHLRQLAARAVPA